MKISHSLRELYSDCHSEYSLLKSEVDRRILATKNQRWHYESRLKAIESFALKAETSRVKKMSEMEDFFGCCIVVENSQGLVKAESLISEQFEIVERRPKTVNFTHKDPSSFVFDDIRIYARIPKDEMLPPKVFEDLVFEIQIKTFLQHAWAIATHDLIYKSDSFNWKSSRVAFQVKAMLEHSELAIAGIDVLTSNIEIEQNKDFKEKNKIIKIVKEIWPVEALPKDLVRLSQNIHSLLKKSSISVADFESLCLESKIIGSSPALDMSPFAAVAISILSEYENAVKRLIKNNQKIFIPPELVERFKAGFMSDYQKVLLKLC